MLNKVVTLPIRDIFSNEYSEGENLQHYIEQEAKEGWRFIQIFTCSKTTFLHLIFESKGDKID
jgi:hypothetical protein